MNHIRLSCFALIASTVLAQAAVAQEEIGAAAFAPYQPAGAPADPAVVARWNFYRDYAQATGLLKQIAAAHPELCRLESLGKSYDGREMWLLTVTNQTLGDESKKPAFWNDGGIHANEIQGGDAVLYTAWYLTEMYDRNDTIKQLLDERVFYMLPMMSPDSRDAHLHEPATTHSPRSGQRPVDDDRDGLFDEDPPEDLDGDGSITQMRVRDPNGRYKPHPKYPAMMVRVEEGEQGEFTLLGQEGYDNDGDGRVNEDGDGYYDPNRDWPWQWQPSYIQGGAYRYPFSLQENRVVGEFIKNHPNIAGAQSYHNTGGMILRGPGALSDRWPRGDIAVFDRLAAPGVEMLPGYRYLEVGTGLYEVWGGEVDWLYAMHGVFAFTNEMNTPFNLFRRQENPGDYIGPDEDRYKFDKLLLFGDGFATWREVDHPQYGKVEVGGQKKNWGRQPPSFMLEEELHRNMAFSLWHADQLPQVDIDEVKVEQLGEGLWQVTAAIVNEKLTPTRSQFNIQKGITPPDRVEITGDNVKTLTALVSESVVFADPSDVQRRPESVRLDTIPAGQPMYVRWLVEGAGKATVTVRSVKGGEASKSIELSE